MGGERVNLRDNNFRNSIVSFYGHRPLKNVSEIIYYVSNATLNSTQSLTY